MKGRKRSIESRKKTSESLRKLPKEKLSGNKGKKMSEETKNKIRNSNTGKKRSDETKRKLSLIKSNISDETRNKLSLSQIGKKKNSNSFSKYVGIYFKKNRIKKWEAYFRYNNKRMFLGASEYEIEAALMYNEAALYYYGKDARLNEITEEEIQELWNKYALF